MLYSNKCTKYHPNNHENIINDLSKTKHCKIAWSIYYIPHQTCEVLPLFILRMRFLLVILYKRVLNLVAVVPIVSFLYYSLLHFLSCLSVQERTHLVSVVQLYPSCIILCCISFLVFLYKRELILSHQFSIILPVSFFVTFSFLFFCTRENSSCLSISVLSFPFYSLSLHLSILFSK